MVHFELDTQSLHERFADLVDLRRMGDILVAFFPPHLIAPYSCRGQASTQQADHSQERIRIIRPPPLPWLLDTSKGSTGHHARLAG